MSVTPVYATIGELFRDEFIFEIPKYQRYYSWTDDHIKDFLDDLNKCYEAREVGEQASHFFGGIVTVDSAIDGSFKKRHYVIDGQQRMSTFVLLMACVQQAYSSLIKLVPKGSDADLTFIKDRVEELKRKYLETDYLKNRNKVMVPRLQMSRVDSTFFDALISGTQDKTARFERESHERLSRAYASLQKAVKAKLNANNTLTEKLDALFRFEQILNSDLTVIHIPTNSMTEAYHFFLVLNDRGTSLTEGDLLKSRTLEMLEDEKFRRQQQSVEAAWDDILADHPDATRDYLNWIYSSVFGVRPKSGQLFDDFVNNYFTSKDGDSSLEDKRERKRVGTAVVTTENAANFVVERVKALLAEIKVCRKLTEGIWPYESAKKPLWDQDRLRLLIKVLKQTNCMPVLLAAATYLSETEFSKIVIHTERFIFRYKTICNGHISPVTKLYLEHAKRIRENGTEYKAKTYGMALGNQLNSSPEASEEVFSARLQQLRYNPEKPNQEMKYLLMTLEHYVQWYRRGQRGEPRCTEVNRVFDFSATSLEHIYPQGAKERDAKLDTVLHDLGNLTFIVPAENGKLGNKIFAEKKLILAQSTVQLNREIADYESWDIESVARRQDDLVEMAKVVFGFPKDAVKKQGASRIQEDQPNVA